LILFFSGLLRKANLSTVALAKVEALLAMTVVNVVVVQGNLELLHSSLFTLNQCHE
jgi:hypothetical protein